jgi:hypothetical protein
MLVRIPLASHLVDRRPEQLVATVGTRTGWFGQYDPVRKPET